MSNIRNDSNASSSSNALVSWSEVSGSDQSTALILLQSVTEIVSPHFSLLPEQSADSQDPSTLFERLKAMLRHAVIHLLDSDMNRLIQILYRIDVDESKVTTAFASDPITEIPDRLTELILERQMQKAIFRYQYEKSLEAAQE
jgi:hypothetical protein